MATNRWDPFGEMVRVQQEMDRMMSRLGMPRYVSEGDGERVWVPNMDVMARDDDMVVRIELPGVKPQHVDVALTDDVLTVSGDRREEAREVRYLMKESPYGRFERRIALPEGVDPDAIAAGFRDGVLEVTLPGAAEEHRPRTQRIPVEGRPGEIR